MAEGDILKVTFRFFFFFFAVCSPLSLTHSLLSLSQFVLSLLPAHLFFFFVKCPCSHGQTITQNLPLCNSLSHSVFDWLTWMVVVVVLVAGGGGRGGWRERRTGRRKDKRHFTHGTQSERTAKECGGWHRVLTWVIGSKIYICKNSVGGGLCSSQHTALRPPSPAHLLQLTFLRDNSSSPKQQLTLTL